MSNYGIAVFTTACLVLSVARATAVTSIRTERQSAVEYADQDDNGADGFDGDVEGAGYAIEAAPDDAALSALITRTFQEDILPNLKTGIPQLRIRPIDPIRSPNYTLVNIDIPGIYRCVSLVDNMVVTGLADVTRSDFQIDTVAKTLRTQFFFPKVEGVSGSGTNCYLFGFPLWRPRRGGHFEFRVEGIKVDGTFSLRPTPSEIVRLEKVDIDFEGAYARGEGTLPTPIEWVTNFLQKYFGRAFFRFLVNYGLSEAAVIVFNQFIDANAWQAILGDFF